jgi:hypothetical protein
VLGWPAWAVAALRGRWDAGVGDTVHRLLPARFLPGLPCYAYRGRRDAWNAKYPY